jgi:hypothetical protein
MFTVDARCDQCWHKSQGCKDRLTALPALSTLASTLTTDPQYVDSPGDGKIICFCTAFTIAAPE